MKVIKDTKQEYNVEFTYGEFVSYAQTRKQSKTCKNRSQESSRKTYPASDRNPWAGTHTFEEAIDLATNGWNSGLKQLALEDGTLAEAGIEMNPSVCGSFVNMPNYLLGMPDSMYEMNQTVDYNLEELTIVCRLDYNANNDGARAMKFAKSTAKIVNKYQSKYAVKLVGMFCSDEGATKLITKVNIKDTNDRFVLNNVAFSFHPAFFRRLWFSFAESLEFVTYGYGTSRSRDDHKQEYRTASGKAILLPHIEATNDGDFDETLIEKINL